MTMRTRRAPQPAAFDDRATSASIGTLATAFCVGGALTLLALTTTRGARREAIAGPADGGPLMRAPLAPKLDETALRAELDYARTLGFDVDKVALTGR
jgi:hypothetical protein